MNRLGRYPKTDTQSAMKAIEYFVQEALLLWSNHRGPGSGDTEGTFLPLRHATIPATLVMNRIVRRSKEPGDRFFSTTGLLMQQYPTF